LGFSRGRWLNEPRGAGAIVQEEGQPVLNRWVARNLATNLKVRQELWAFYTQNGRETVAMRRRPGLPAPFGKLPILIP
jgi:hypothetical protein